MCGRNRSLQAAAAAVLALAAPAHAAVTTEFDVFTPFTSGGGEVNGIVLGPDGNLWVAETLAGKVAKVSTAGQHVGEIKLKDGAKPISLATGPGGTVWAALSGTKELARIVAAGGAVTYVSTEGPGATCGPVAIVQGPGDRMYFTAPQTSGCPSAARVGRVNADLTNLATKPDLGSAYDIDTLGGKLFVTDPTAGVVRRVSADLDSEAVSATIGGTPDGIAAGPDNKIWFTLFNETGGVGRIAASFSNNQQPENVFQPGKPLKYAFGITAGPEGAMFVAARDSSRVARVRPDGSFNFYDIPNARTPWQITPGADEDLWYTDIYGNRVGRLVSNRPRVKTGPALIQGPSGATITAAVDPRGSAASVRFEYGRTTAYGASTPAQTFPAAITASPVSAPLAALTPNTTYHYRVVAANEEGETAGANATFSTPPAGGTPQVSFRVQGLRVADSRRFPRSLRITRVRVVGLTRGATLRMYCNGGTRRRCAFRSKRISRSGSKVNLASHLRGRYLKAGASVDFRASKPGHVGFVRRIRIGATRVRVTTLCMPVGSSTVRTRC